MLMLRFETNHPRRSTRDTAASLFGSIALLACAFALLSLVLLGPLFLVLIVLS